MHRWIVTPLSISMHHSLQIMFISSFMTGHLFWKATILGGLYREVPLYITSLGLLNEWIFISHHDLLCNIYGCVLSADPFFFWWLWEYVDGLVQDCSISSALAMEILLSCTKPSMSSYIHIDNIFEPSRGVSHGGGMLESMWDWSPPPFVGSFQQIIEN